MTHARSFTLSVFGLEACFQPAHHIAVKADLVKKHMGLHRWHRKPAKPAESTLRHKQNPFMVGKHYPSYILLKKKNGKHYPYYTLRPCLVPTQKLYSPSHRMFGHMHGALNIDKK
jgi:hypothetical protein